MKHWTEHRLEKLVDKCDSQYGIPNSDMIIDVWEKDLITSISYRLHQFSKCFYRDHNKKSLLIKHLKY